MATRLVRIFLRRKKDVHQSVKVVTNARVPGRGKPVQIHLGYLSLMFDGGIPEAQRKKLNRNLCRLWFKYFQNVDVDVDWDHAERKLEEFRNRCRGDPPSAVSSVPAQVQSALPHARRVDPSDALEPARELRRERWQRVAALRK